MGKPEREDKLWPGHEKLRSQYLRNLKLFVPTFGVNPLKKLVSPSFLIILSTILNPRSGFSKFLFWIRVLITSSGAEMIIEADAPAMDAIKFCVQVALL